MDRRTFIKSLSVVPFIPLSIKELENEYFRYYFGGYGTGKTTRLVNDAVKWLMMNPGTRGLFITNHFHNIRYTLDRINRPTGSTYSKLHRTLDLPNKSSLRFTIQNLIDNEISCGRYQGLWTDQILKNNRDLAETVIEFRDMCHVISMDEAHDLHYRLGFKPILISNRAYVLYENLKVLEFSVYNKLAIPKLWGFR